MSYIGVYCIQNKINGKRYIGSSKNVHKRKKSHFNALRRLAHRNRKLQRSYNIHGEDAFDFSILEFLEDERLLIEVEQKYLDESKPEYNINRIAESSLGVKRSEETKNKVRLANLGLKHPEWRNLLKSQAQGGERHWTKRKVFSTAAKEKMSATHLALYANGYISPLTGRKLTTEERLEKQRQQSKPILRILGEEIIEFASTKEACNKFGYTPYSISLCCRGLKKNYKGYEWKFK